MGAVAKAMDKGNTLDRRAFMKIAGLGLGAIAAGVGLPKKAHAFQMPSDETLLRYMNQTVEETLAETNYIPVDDTNYQEEVSQEHLPGNEKQPVMVLFYNNRGKPDQGDAALARVLSERFPEIKLCAYKLSDGDRTPRDVFDHVLEEYPPLREGKFHTPALLFYKEKDGQIVNAGENFNLHGGWKKLSQVKSDINYYTTNLPKIMSK